MKGGLVVAIVIAAIVVACGGGPTTPCSFTLSSAAINLAANGGNAGVTVATTAACQWAATSNAAFIVVTAGAASAGNGAVAFAVGANSATGSRTGTLTIAGQTLTVTQGGASSTITFTFFALGSLPGARVGLPYAGAVCLNQPPLTGPNDLCLNPTNVSGGQAPYHFQAQSGFLPLGLTLHPNGFIDGTPTAAGMGGPPVCAVDLAGVTSTSCPVATIIVTDDVSGNWQGQFHTDAVGLVPAQDGNWRGTLTVGGVINGQSLVTIRWWDSYHQQTLVVTTTLTNTPNGRTLDFTIDTPPDDIHLTGTINNTGTAINGVLVGPLLDPFAGRARGIWFGAPGGPGGG
jgi:hypothetical protein